MPQQACAQLRSLPASRQQHGIVVAVDGRGSGTDVDDGPEPASKVDDVKKLALPRGCFRIHKADTAPRLWFQRGDGMKALDYLSHAAQRGAAVRQVEYDAA